MVETIEHLLLECPRAKELWKLAPVKWDGEQEMEGNLRKWWATITEAKNRPQGMDHLAVTANILWHIWKSRNKMVFNAKDYEPLKTINKACNEWMEWEIAQKKGSSRSTVETVILQQREQQSNPRTSNRGINVRTLRVVVQRNKETSRAGYGVSMRGKDDHIIKGWGLSDNMVQSQLQQEAEAVKLTLSKAAEQRWLAIRIEISNKKLLDHIPGKLTSNIWMTTLLEDIQALRRLFPMCYFCVAEIEKTDLSYTLAAQALSNYYDMEWVYPIHLC